MENLTGGIETENEDIETIRWYRTWGDGTYPRTGGVLSESHPRLLIFPWPRLIVVLPGGALNVVDFGTWGPYFSTRLSIGCVAFMCGGCSVSNLWRVKKSYKPTKPTNIHYICDTYAIHHWESLPLAAKTDFWTWCCIHWESTASIHVPSLSRPRDLKYTATNWNSRTF